MILLMINCTTALFGILRYLIFYVIYAGLAYVLNTCSQFKGYLCDSLQVKIFEIMKFRLVCFDLCKLQQSLSTAKPWAEEVYETTEGVLLWKCDLFWGGG